MTKSGQILPKPQRVVMFVPPGAQLIGIIGFIEAFDAVNRLRVHQGRPPVYEVLVCGLDEQTASVTGLGLATRPAARVRRVDTLVVGGALSSSQVAREPELRRQVARLADRADRVVAICGGAFVLGELGWLEGRRCTCHWMGLDNLRARFPTAEVQADALFTEDEGVFTSAGASAGIDLALHLIRRDCGPRMALMVARSLVVFAMRPGGQSQFGSAVRVRSGTGQRLHDLIAGIHERPAGDHSVPSLARRAGMSPRNFARVFRDQTGQTPGAYVARARVEAAQRALAHSDAPLPAIAEACGFGHEKTLRRTFLKVAGVTPSAWRRRFGLGAQPGERLKG